VWSIVVGSQEKEKEVNGKKDDNFPRLKASGTWKYSVIRSHHRKKEGVKGYALIRVRQGKDGAKIAHAHILTFYEPLGTLGGRKKIIGRGTRGRKFKRNQLKKSLVANA